MGSPLRVGLIGRGAIGEVIASRLAAGTIPGVVLAGVMRRHPGSDEVRTLADLRSMDCDVVVEAAGHEAVRSYGEAVLESGADFIVLSAGSLADPQVENALRRSGPGRLFVSSGAIGGLDIARALMESGSLETVSIRSSTTTDAVAGEGQALSPATEPRLVARGSAREVALAFPLVANVAATAALSTLGLDATAAELWVDPAGTEKRHEIELGAGASQVSIQIVNALSESNPRTSAVTPFSVLRLLRERVEPFAAGL